MPLSLHGRRILVTRARGQASALATALEAEGATTILIPTIEIAPPVSFCALDAALASIRSFDWLIFTSANAVHAYAERARALRLDPHARRIAAIGNATARALQQSGVAEAADLVPAQAVAESLAEALRPHAAGSSMLLVRAADARDTLPDALCAAGAQLTIAAAYRNVSPPDALHRLCTLFETAAPHAITFTSASTAQNLSALLQAAHLAVPSATVLASIGPVTSAAMRDLGLRPTLEAKDASIASLVSAIAVYYHALAAKN